MTEQEWVVQEMWLRTVFVYRPSGYRGLTTARAREGACGGRGAEVKDQVMLVTPGRMRQYKS